MIFSALRGGLRYEILPFSESIRLAETALKVITWLCSTSVGLNGRASQTSCDFLERFVGALPMLTRSKAADILRFVIVEGVIKFGIPYALLSILVQYLMHHELSHEVLYVATAYPLASGVIYGLALWVMPKKLRERPPNKKQALLWAVLAIGLAAFLVLQSR